MVAVDLQRGFGVRVIRGFEGQLRDSDFVEKKCENSNQVPEADVLVGHQTFDLVELREMGGVEGFVTKYCKNKYSGLFIFPVFDRWRTFFAV